MLVDESNTISNKTGLVVHLKACLAEKPTTFFLDLVHLPSTDALSIVNAILATLTNMVYQRSCRTKTSSVLPQTEPLL